MKGLTVALILVVAVIIEFFIIKMPMVSFLVYLVFLTIVFLILSREEKLDDFGKLLVVLMIIPLARILQLFLDLDFPWKEVVGYLTLLVLGVYYLREFKVKLGIKKNWFIFPVAILLGFLLGIIGRGIFEEKFSIWFIVLVALSEELFFRGLLQNLSEPVVGKFFGVLFPAILYGIVHISLGLFGFVFFLVFGLILGVVYSFSKNIWMSFLVSLAANLIMFVFSPVQ